MTVLKGMDSPPGRAAPHLVADFVELMCLATVDGEYGVADLRALRKAKDKDGATVRDHSERELLLAEDDPTRDELDTAVAAALDIELAEEEPEQLEVAGDDPSAANADPGPAAGDDNRSAEGAEVADVLSYRGERFGDAYPFELFDADNLRLSQQLEPQQQLYVLLLIASCLSKLPKTEAAQVTATFERLAPAALSGHLGPRAEAHLFGTSAAAGDRYTGTLWSKLQQLETDFRIKLIAQQEEIETNYSGDNGLDAVAWVPTGDNAETMVSLFAQCACGKRWRGKQQEASEVTWSGVFSFRSPIVNMLLIPYSFRKADGSWHQDYQVERGVLLDRERLIEAVRGADTELTGQLSEQLAERIIRQGIS